MNTTDLECVGTLEELFEPLGLIAETSSGFVSYAKMKPVEGQTRVPLVGIKTFRSSCALELDIELEFLEMLLREPKDHLVRILGLYRDEKLNLHCVMEYADCDLWAFLNQNGAMDEGRAKRMLFQVATGLKQLYDMGFWHLDVSLENILVFQNGDHLKLSDFGSVWPITTEVDAIDACHGKTLYYPPELAYSDSVLVSKVGSFSFGVIMFALLFGKLPFDQASSENEYFLALSYGDVEDVLEMIKEETQVSVSNDACNLLRKLFCLERERCEVSDIFKDVWFNS